MTESQKTLSVTFGDFAFRMEGYDEPRDAINAVAGWLAALSGDAPATGTPSAGTPSPTARATANHGSTRTPVTGTETDSAPDGPSSDRAGPDRAGPDLAGPDLAGSDRPAPGVLSASPSAAPVPPTDPAFGAKVERLRRILSASTAMPGPPQPSYGSSHRASEAITEMAPRSGAKEASSGPAMMQHPPVGPSVSASVNSEANSEAGSPRSPPDKPRSNLQPMSPGSLIRIASARDGGLDRILRETDNLIAERNGQGRNAALAHLRAAAAAKRPPLPPRQMSDPIHDPVPEPEADPTTKPATRPATGSEEAPRSPLRLVASQRIKDRERASGPATPTAPAGLPETPPSAPSSTPATTAPSPSRAAAHSSSFADHVQRTGARDLPDLLEAAAAFVSLSEGRTTFSRPQIEVRVTKLRPGAYPREELLRAFGILLRQGKIRRISGGEYAITGEIGFRPS